jgi:hypothetical protein
MENFTYWIKGFSSSQFITYKLNIIDKFKSTGNYICKNNLLLYFLAIFHLFFFTVILSIYI